LTRNRSRRRRHRDPRRPRARARRRWNDAPPHRVAPVRSGSPSRSASVRRPRS
jgi:hypothetical protein